MQTALFQRKSRSGWLEELDGIREEALDAPEGGVGSVGDPDDIWTDLREGGVYSDPHEISSLYADDETPDLPVSKPAAKNGRSSRAARPRRAAADADADAGAEVAPIVAAPEPMAPAAPGLIVDDDIWTTAPPGTDPLDGLAGQHAPDDQMLVQPAPHPVHPQEMWHPAELVATPMPLDPAGSHGDPRLAASDLLGPASAPAPVLPPPPAGAPAFDPFAIPVVEAHDPAAAAAVDAYARSLEAELRETGVPGSGTGLVEGPIARRHRRNRPEPDRQRAVLPGADERSPLPEAPLPPAALPVRDSAPATEAPVVELLAPPTISPFARRATAPAPDLAGVATPSPAPVADEPPFPNEPPFDVPVEVAPEAGEPAAELVAAADLAVPAAALDVDAGSAAIGSSVEIEVDGLVPVPGTIVRVGGVRKAAAEAHPTELRVALDEGWCWVSPGEGIPLAVRVELEKVVVSAEPGATLLVVVEADRSAFIAVADGRAELCRGDEAGPLVRGSIVMVDPAGVAQIDEATDDEIVADPIVAENLALDAEL